MFFFQAEDGIRYWSVTGFQTCALLFSSRRRHTRLVSDWSSDVCSSDLFLTKIIGVAQGIGNFSQESIGVASRCVANVLAAGQNGIAVCVEKGGCVDRKSVV